MDGFGDNFDQPEVDPAAEFLAREQDQLAGLEDELNPGNAPPAADDATFGTQGSAPLTGSFEMIDNFGQQDGLGPDLLSATEGVPSEVKAASEPLDAESKETEAENSEVAAADDDDDGCAGNEEAAVAAVFDVDNSAGDGDNSATCDGGEDPSTERVAVGDCDDSVAASEGSASVIDSTVDDYMGSNAKVQPDGLTSHPKIFATPTPPKPVVKEEPEKIRKWREEQKKRLEEKDANEEKRKEELREQAKKELEEWYKHHEEQIAKTKAANREAAKNAEKQFVAEAGEIEPGTEWERIAKLCDFNPKSSKTSKDVSRMRSIILQLKQTPPAAKRA